MILQGNRKRQVKAVEVVSTLSKSTWTSHRLRKGYNTLKTTRKTTAWQKPSTHLSERGKADPSEGKAKETPKEEKARKRAKASPPRELAKTAPMESQTSMVHATIAVNGAIWSDTAQNGTSQRNGQMSSLLATQESRVEWQCASHAMNRNVRSPPVSHLS